MLAVAAAVCCAFWLSRTSADATQFRGALAVSAVAVLLHRDATRRYAALVSRVEAIKGVRTSGARLAAPGDPLVLQAALTRNLVADLEDSYFRLIRTNIQLLSLKEVGRSIIASLDQERTVQSVLQYLHRGVGFRVRLVLWRPEEASSMAA
jgi:hypothetical protein